MAFEDPASFSKVTDPRESILPAQDLFDPRFQLQPKPALTETFEAAWDQNNPLANLGQLWHKADEFFQPVENTYDPFEKNRGTVYEKFPDAFLYVNNDDQLERIRARIDKDNWASDILSRSGLIGVGAQLTSAFLDPIMLIPFGGEARALVKGGQILRNAGMNAGRTALLFGGTTALSEFTLMQQHYNRTVADSAKTVGFASLLGGVIGASISALRGAKLNSVQNVLEKAYELPPENKFATGDTQFFKNWQDASITLKREAAVNKIPSLTVGQRMATSPISMSRKVGQAIAENGMLVEGELGGPALETIVNQRHAANWNRMHKSLTNGFKEYLQDANRLNLKQRLLGYFEAGNEFTAFGNELARALNNGDISKIPQIEKIAKDWRKAFNQVGEEAAALDMFGVKADRIKSAEAALAKSRKELKSAEAKLKKNPTSKKLLNTAEKRRGAVTTNEAVLRDAKNFKPSLKDVSLGKTAKSFFPRIYNKVKMNKFSQEFENDLSEYLIRAEGMDAIAAKTTARDVFNSITVKNAFTGFDPIKITKGPFKGRTLDVPYDVLEPWLINDPLIVLNRWLKTVLSDIELTKRFGSKELEDIKKLIFDEAEDLINANPENAAKLRKTRKSDLEDLDVLITRLRGTQGLAFEDNRFYQSMRTIRNWNNARLMGGVPLNVFVDSGQIVLQNGFSKTFGGLVELFLTKVFKPKVYKEFIEDFADMGIGVEASVHSRRTIFELGTGEALGNRAEDLSRAAADFTWKATLMSNIDGFTKRLAAYVSSQRIYRNVLKGSENLSKKELEWMGNLGIRKADYSGLKSQFLRHSRIKDKYRVFNIDNWGNTHAETIFTAALKKVEGISIVTPGIGDAPKIFDNPAFQLLFQYKRFALAAAQRSLIPALQRTDAGVLAGLTTMFTGAMLREVLASLIAGRDPTEIETEVLIGRAVKRMDMAAWIPDLWDNASALTGRDTYNRSPIEDIMGPSAGWLRSTSSSLQGMKNILDGEPPTKTQIRSMRQLVPMQNLFYINGLLTGLEKDINQKLGNN